MGSRTRLVVALLAVAVAAVLVWQLAVQGRGTTQLRVEVDRGGAADGATLDPDAAAVAAGQGEPEGTDPGTRADAGTELPGGGVRVRVVADGQPVADAAVYFIAEDGDVDQVEAGDEPGLFEIPATGDLTVGAAHARHGPARAKVHAKPGEITDVTLELPPGETLDVLVVDDRGGAPVAGAGVLVLRAGTADAIEGFNGRLEDLFTGVDEPTDIDFGLLSQLDLTDFQQIEQMPSVVLERLFTDDAGRVRVTGLPPGTVDILVTHPDYVGTRLRKQPVAAGREAVARLSAGGSLTVIAPYVNGRAAEGHGCWIIRPGLMFSMPVAMQRVDARGEAHFPHLPPGPLRVTVGMGDDIAFFGMGVTVDSGAPPPDEAAEEAVEEGPIASGAVVIAKGQHRTLDFRGREVARIEGLYLIGATPHQGGMVLLLGGEGYREQVGMTEADELGRFVFERVAPGEYRVMGVGDAGAVARANVEVKPGAETVHVRLELPAGAIVGRVLDAEGKPAKDGRILVVPRAGVSGGQAAHVGDLLERLSGFGEAGEDGRFRVAGLAAGEYRVFGAVAKRLDAVDVMLSEGEEAQVEFRLDDVRLRRLVVRLANEEGDPVEGTVTIVGADGGIAESLALMMDDEAEAQLAGTGGAPVHEVFLAPGRYRVVAARRGLAPVLGELVDMRANRELNLTLGPGVAVELALTGPDGPLANREVDVQNEFGLRLGANSPIEIMLAPQLFRTDGGGILSLANVPPGRYTLRIDGREAGRFDVGREPVSKRIRVD